MHFNYFCALLSLVVVVSHTHACHYHEMKASRLSLQELQIKVMVHNITSQQNNPRSRASVPAAKKSASTSSQLPITK